jgi:UDP-N-acetyl-D-mannosaminuronic acid dehydrogenase
MISALDKRICVMGLGYIGLPTAAILASRGYFVHGVDVSRKAVDAINEGRAHIVEPDLGILVQAAAQTGRLKAFSEPAESDIYLICVPTPVTDDHQPDISFVIVTTEMICPYLKAGDLVILESTSPPGTTAKIARIVKDRTGLQAPDILFAHAPERVLPGRILREVVDNDRIVGGLDDASTEACAEFYATFVTGNILKTTARMAETVKLVENAYRDVNIAFANELSLLALDLDLDVWELIRLANRHPRVNILNPGPGVGGHCIAVDPWFLAASAPESTRLIQTARRINLEKTDWVYQRILACAERFRHPKIACLGLAYKPDIDDLRESPALEIVRRLKAARIGELFVVEPNIREFPEFELCGLDEALSAADIVVFLVAHRPFLKIPVLRLREKLIIDTCGVNPPR